jgi:hypothetical protein
MRAIEQTTVDLLQEAERRLHSLSPERLRTANDFLACLEEREENEATQELLALSGFEAAFRHAVDQAATGDVARLEDIYRDTPLFNPDAC